MNSSLVQGSVESFECGKSSVGSEFRQSYRLFELSTTVLLQFIQASPTLAQEWPVHIIGDLRQQKVGEQGVVYHMSSKTPPKLGYLKERFFFHIVIFIP
jgi:hypothetical protein